MATTWCVSHLRFQIVFIHQDESVEAGLFLETWEEATNNHTNNHEVKQLKYKLNHTITLIQFCFIRAKSFIHSMDSVVYSSSCQSR